MQIAAYISSNKYLLSHNSRTFVQGWAYVEYENESDAAQAVVKTDQTVIDGFTIKVGTLRVGEVPLIGLIIWASVALFRASFVLLRLYNSRWKMMSRLTEFLFYANQVFVCLVHVAFFDFCLIFAVLFLLEPTITDE